MGLDLSLHPFALNPSYREIEHLPLAEKVARLEDPEFRRRLIAEEPDDPHEFFCHLVSEKDMLFVLGSPPNYHPSASESVEAIARAQGRDTAEVIYDIMLQRGGREILYRPLGNTDGEERFHGVGHDMFGQDSTIIGLGDGGAHYGMICDAAYPTYVLTYWSTQAHGDRGHSTEALVKMMSRDTAEAVGLNDRGLLKPGYKADINVIDLARLRLHAPHIVTDLPAGGRRLKQEADGYDATIVSGVITYRNGVATGALPGRLQRHARPAPAESAAA
jgi:N-acyl-D-aspartate/D-glutamate deacylase